MPYSETYRERLFPFHLVIDTDLKVISVGHSLRKFVPITLGGSIEEYFEVHQPKKYNLTYEDLRASEGTLMFLSIKSLKDIRLRGEWVYDSHVDQLFFAGAPTFTSWDEVHGFGLSFDDFAKHDQTVDMLMLYQTQRHAMNSVRQLSDRLVANELFVRFFQKLPLLIWRTNVDKRFDYFNDTWIEFTGRQPLNEVGFGWTDHIHPDDVSRFISQYLTCFNLRRPFESVIRLRNKHGDYRILQVLGHPYHDAENKFSGYIGGCNDITDIKLNEDRLKDMNSMKSKLFGVISHDLKGPMSNIIGLVDILKKNYGKAQPEVMDKVIDKLDTSARTTYNLVQSLLDWSRSQQDRISMKPVSFDFNLIGQEVLASLRPQAEAKRIVLELSDGNINKVTADKEMFKTVLRNLVSNAIKFTPERGKVKISALKESGQLKFRISDNGVGISSEVMPMLFDDKHRPSTFGTSNEKGTGLGLLLCKDFVERHNGKIWAESSEGQGTDFIFTIPEVGKQD